MVNLEWYRTFKYIYESNSLTVASQKLYMTQPGVSKQLAALEAHVGQTLFERTSRKLLPTEYGKFLYTQVIGYLEGLERAERKFKKGSNKKCPSIVVGCSYDIFIHSFIRKISDMNLYVTFRFGNEQELADQLEREKIHLLITEQKYTGYDHEFRPMFRDKLSLIASPSVGEPPFPRIHKSNSKEIGQWLSAQTWYAYDNDLTYINDYWKENFSTRPDIMARYVFPSAKDIALALQTGEGISVIPEFVCNKEIADGRLVCLFPDAVSPAFQAWWAYKSNVRYLYEINLFMKSLER